MSGFVLCWLHFEENMTKLLDMIKAMHDKVEVQVKLISLRYIVHVGMVTIYSSVTSLHLITLDGFGVH